MKIIISVLVLILFGGGFYFWVSQKTTPTQLPASFENVPSNSVSATTKNPTPPSINSTSLVFDRSTIQVGDHIGNFVVTDIKPISGSIVNPQDPEGNMAITFKGSAKLVGIFLANFPEDPSAGLKLSDESKTKLPYDKNWGISGTILIENPKNRPSNVTNNTTVEVETGIFTYRMFPSQTYSSISALSIGKVSQ